MTDTSTSQRATPPSIALAQLAARLKRLPQAASWFGLVLDRQKRAIVQLPAADAPLWSYAYQRALVNWPRSRGATQPANSPPYVCLVGEIDRLPAEDAALDPLLKDVLRPILRGDHAADAFAPGYRLDAWPLTAAELDKATALLEGVSAAQKPRPAPAPLTAIEARQRLDETWDALEDARQQVRARLTAVLEGLGDQALDSFAARREVALRVQELLGFAGLRVACPHCGQPATLRCYQIGRARHGVFCFEHRYPKAPVRHGGQAAFPANLKIVPAPPDKRRQPKRGATS
jgi:hypothetical protein